MPYAIHKTLTSDMGYIVVYNLISYGFLKEKRRYAPNVGLKYPLGYFDELSDEAYENDVNYIAEDSLWFVRRTTNIDEIAKTG